MVRPNRLVEPAELAPGDVLAVRDHTFWARIIRIGAALGDNPNVWNHVVVYIKYEGGVHWGIEGRPGGVGSVDIGKYLNDPLSVSNAAQPKTFEQRDGVITIMNAMMADHVQYDWPAIAVDTLNAIRPLWVPDDSWPATGLPGQVVCSSAASFAYKRMLLANPAPGRFCTPYHWGMFNMSQGWG